MGLLDAGLSLASQGWSQDFTQQMLQQQQQFNHREAQLDRLWQTMMYEHNNLYNSPAEQMSRARAAGLNPSLLYGQPVAEAQMSPSGAQASSSSGSGNAVNLGGIGNEVDSIYKALSMGKQLELLSKSIQEKDADIGLKGGQKALAYAEADTARKRLLEIDANINKLNASADLDRALGYKAAEETRRVIKDIQLFDETFADQVDIIKNKKNLTKAEADNYVRECNARINQLDQLANYYLSLQNLTNEQKEFVSSHKAFVDAQKQLLDKQVDLINKYGDAKEVISMINSTLNACSNFISSIGYVASRGSLKLENHSDYTIPFDNASTSY